MSAWMTHMAKLTDFCVDSLVRWEFYKAANSRGVGRAQIYFPTFICLMLSIPFERFWILNVCMCNTTNLFNPLWPSDVIWRQGSR